MEPYQRQFLPLRVVPPPRDSPAPAPPGRGNGAFVEFVFKLHERCNLNCDYCYIYHAGDTHYQDHRGAMSAKVSQQAALRLAEHVRLHGLRKIGVVFHGGEPLLAGIETIRRVCQQIRAVLPPSCRVNFGIQTNGTRLKRQILQELQKLHVQVAVSLDGGREANDRHRLNHASKSSFHQVEAALQLLMGPFRDIYGGILAVVDLQNDPVETHTALMKYQPPTVDYLWPVATWDKPPVHLPEDPSPTPYADWVLKILQAHPNWLHVPIRLVQDLISQLLGASIGSDFWGFSIGPVVIGVAGNIERVDTMRIAYNGAAQTVGNPSVFNSTLDKATADPAVLERALGIFGLCTTCRSCPLVQTCGGGHPPHRYRSDNGTDNPSVYCADLMKLIHAVSEHLHSLGIRLHEE